LANVPVASRSTVKPVSLVELSVHARSIRDVENGVAVRLLGAATGFGVVALAVFEYADWALEPCALTR
jgi:hypothetical protein